MTLSRLMMSSAMQPPGRRQRPGVNVQNDRGEDRSVQTDGQADAVWFRGDPNDKKPSPFEDKHSCYGFSRVNDRPISSPEPPIPAQPCCRYEHLGHKPMVGDPADKAAPVASTVRCCAAR